MIKLNEGIDDNNFDVSDYAGENRIGINCRVKDMGDAQINITYDTGVNTFDFRWDILEPFKDKEIREKISHRLTELIKANKNEFAENAKKITNAYLITMQSIAHQYTANLNNSMEVIKREIDGGIYDTDNRK